VCSGLPSASCLRNEGFYCQDIGGVRGVSQRLQSHHFPWLFQANEGRVQASRPRLREEEPKQGTDGASKHIRHERSGVLADDILDPSSNLVSEETEILDTTFRPPGRSQKPRVWH